MWIDYCSGIHFAIDDNYENTNTHNSIPSTKLYTKKETETANKTCARPRDEIHKDLVCTIIAKKVTRAANEAYTFRESTINC